MKFGKIKFHHEILAIITLIGIIFYPMVAAAPSVSYTDPSLVGRNTYGDQARSLAVDGDLAFVADCYSGLLIFDLEDPTNPTLLAELALDGCITDIALNGNYAYLTSKSEGLLVVDIQDPDAPELVESLAMGGEAQAVRIDGDVAFVAAYDAGVSIVNISTPLNLVEITTYNTNGLAYDVFVAGDLLCVADWSYGLLTLNISDLTSPTFLDQFHDGGEAQGLFVEDSIVYLADRTNGLEIYDISDPSVIEKLGAFDDRGLAFDVVVSDDIAYVADWTDGLELLDISDPANIVEVGQRFDGGEAMAVILTNDYAMVADGSQGIEVMDKGIDTDGDSFNDWEETNTFGTNPNDPNDVPDLSGGFNFVEFITSTLGLVIIGAVGLVAVIVSVSRKSSKKVTKSDKKGTLVDQTTEAEPAVDLNKLLNFKSQNPEELILNIKNLHQQVIKMIKTKDFIKADELLLGEIKQYMHTIKILGELGLGDLAGKLKEKMKYVESLLYHVRNRQFLVDYQAMVNEINSLISAQKLEAVAEKLEQMKIMVDQQIKLATHVDAKDDIKKYTAILADFSNVIEYSVFYASFIGYTSDYINIVDLAANNKLKAALDQVDPVLGDLSNYYQVLEQNQAKMETLQKLFKETQQLYKAISDMKDQIKKAYEVLIEEGNAKPVKFATFKFNAKPPSAPLLGQNNEEKLITDMIDKVNNPSFLN